MENRRAPLLYAPTVDSTNLALRRLAAEGAEDGTVFWSAEQSRGRGRLGRSFVSPPGGLYYSMLLSASANPERDLPLTPAAGLAVCRAVERACSLRCGLKWPNDLLWRDRKLCGILAEGFAVGGKRRLALGIGVNVNTRGFPSELSQSAVSLWQITGRETSLLCLAELLTEELDALLTVARSNPPALLEEYRARCLTTGRQVLVLRDGMVCEAEALDIGEDYSLLVRRPDGRTEAVRFGEVTIR